MSINLIFFCVLLGWELDVIGKKSGKGVWLQEEGEKWWVRTQGLWDTYCSLLDSCFPPSRERHGSSLRNRSWCSCSGHIADLPWLSDQSSPLPGNLQVLSKHLLSQPQASLWGPLCSSFDGALWRVCGLFNLKDLLTSISALRNNYMAHEKIY